MKTTMKFLLSLLVPVAVFGATGLTNWQTQFPDGGWDGECIVANNDRQSPIDLPTTDITCADGTGSEVGTIPKKTIQFNANTFNAGELTLINNGNGIKVYAADGGTLGRTTVTFEDGTVRTYDAAQFHFHALSEHTVGGNYYPLEVHIVHLIEGKQMADLSTEDDALVLGFFYEVGDTDNEFLTNIGFGEMPQELGATITNPGPIEFPVKYDADGTDNTSTTVLNYPGGLTTPGCNGLVDWYVFINNVLPISQAQVDQYVAAFYSTSYPSQTTNYRAIQDLAGRPLFAQSVTLSGTGAECQTQTATQAPLVEAEALATETLFFTATALPDLEAEQETEEETGDETTEEETGEETTGDDAEEEGITEGEAGVEEGDEEIGDEWEEVTDDQTTEGGIELEVTAEEPGDLSEGGDSSAAIATTLAAALAFL